MSDIITDYTRYQKQTSFYKHVNENNAPELTYLALGLAGEAGELADEVKKIVRDVGQNDTYAYHAAMTSARVLLVDELGDVLWYLNKLCAFLGTDITDLMIDNTLKLHERWGKQNNVGWPFKGITEDEARNREEELPF